MPRKNRRRKGPRKDQDGERRSRRRKLDTAKAEFWKRRIRAGREARRDYDKNARKVMDYFTANYGGLFQRADVRTNFMAFDGASAVSVPKSAQVRNSLGPHLYPSNPRRVVTARSEDMVLVALGRVLEAYVNYTPGESGLSRQCRRSIDDSLLRGRGVAYTGFDTTRGIVTSWYIPSRDLLIDPDATCLEEAFWIAIRRREPVWRVKRRTKDLEGGKHRWRVRQLKGNYQSAALDGETVDGHSQEDDERGDEFRASMSNDLIEYFDVYSKMGIGVRGADFDAAGPNTTSDEDDFVKFTICLDHDVPLYEGDWEVPLYLDSDWPIATLDYLETLDRLWPESVMSQVMPLQYTMDLLTSLQLNSCKFRSVFRLFVDDAAFKPKDIDRLRCGTPGEIFLLKNKQGEDLHKKAFVVPMGSTDPEVARERDWVERQFEATTGVTPVLHGASEPESKDRSATASRIKSEATASRLGDMKARTEEWNEVLGRHECLMVRLELDPEEVSPYVNVQGDIGLFMVSVVVPEELLAERHPVSGKLLFPGGELPLRDTRQQEDRERESSEDPLTIEYVSPMSATFFDSHEEAMGALLEELLPELAELSQVDYRVMVLAEAVGNGADETGARAFDPEAAIDPMSGELNLPEGVSVRMVKVEDVWSATKGISAEELVREYGYTIATGSMQKIDKQREQDLVEQEVAQVMPVAERMGDVQLMNAIMSHRDEAHEVPPDKRLPQIQPPPPPPGAEAAAP